MKLKTNKGALKRIKITGKNKILRRPTKQGHFNAKASGNATRNKRKSAILPIENINKLKKQLPYNI